MKYHRIALFGQKYDMDFFLVLGSPGHIFLESNSEGAGSRKIRDLHTHRVQ